MRSAPSEITEARRIKNPNRNHKNHSRSHAADHLLECRQSVTGGLCSKNVLTELSHYEYDKAGEQTAITPKADASGSTFAYNAAKETKAITPSGGSEQALSYGGTGQDDLVSLGSSTTIQNSLLGPTREVSSSGTNYYARTPTGLLIDQRTPSGNFNPLFDAQGDVIAQVSSSGKVERTFRYGPYGENVESGGEQTVPFHLGFQGGYRMPGGNAGKGKEGKENKVPNGLYHFGQRYYDPTVGRWTQEDPFGGGYAFVGDDPINGADLSGECSRCGGTGNTPGEGSQPGSRCHQYGGHWVGQRCVGVRTHGKGINLTRICEVVGGTGAVRMLFKKPITGRLGVATLIGCGLYEGGKFIVEILE